MNRIYVDFLNNIHDELKHSLANEIEDYFIFGYLSESETIRLWKSIELEDKEIEKWLSHSKKVCRILRDDRKRK